MAKLLSLANVVPGDVRNIKRIVSSVMKNSDGKLQYTLSVQLETDAGFSLELILDGGEKHKLVGDWWAGEVACLSGKEI